MTGPGLRRTSSTSGLDRGGGAAKDTLETVGVHGDAAGGDRPGRDALPRQTMSSVGGTSRGPSLARGCRGLTHPPSGPSLLGCASWPLCLWCPWPQRRLLETVREEVPPRRERGGCGAGAGRTGRMPRPLGEVALRFISAGNQEWGGLGAVGSLKLKRQEHLTCQSSRGGEGPGPRDLKKGSHQRLPGRPATPHSLRWVGTRAGATPCPLPQAVPGCWAPTRCRLCPVSGALRRFATSSRLLFKHFCLRCLFGDSSGAHGGRPLRALGLSAPRIPRCLRTPPAPPCLMSVLQAGGRPLLWGHAEAAPRGTGRGTPDRTRHGAWFKRSPCGAALGSRVAPTGWVSPGGGA